jgi:hypothetical protein
MLNSVLTVHEGLAGTGRLRSLSRQGERISAVEFGLLVLLGLAAAAFSGLVKLNLQIPGHNIIRVIFPLAFGLAVVPRRGAATIMGLSGSAGAGLFLLGGARGFGAGAVTSLVLTGFLLDLALVKARRGPSLYVRLVLAGLAANLAALLVRGGSKVVGVGFPGLPLELWWPKAAVTYAACGALAGLASALVWFRFAAHPPGHSGDETAA